MLWYFPLALTHITHHWTPMMAQDMITKRQYLYHVSENKLPVLEWTFSFLIHNASRLNQWVFFWSQPSTTCFQPLSYPSLANCRWAAIFFYFSYFLNVCVHVCVREGAQTGQLIELSAHLKNTFSQLTAALELQTWLLILASFCSMCSKALIFYLFIGYDFAQTQWVNQDRFVFKL